MRQVFLEKGTLAIKEVCEPALDDYSILVSVYYSFISVGAGLTKIINADQDKFYQNIPNKVKKVIELVKNRGFDYTAMVVKDRLGSRITTLGYSCSGTVIAAGKKVKKFRVGDLVACVGPGVANHADVVCVPQNLVARVKSADFLKEASLTGVGAIALQAIRRADLSLGETVVIFGLETLGQMLAQLVKLSGCKVIAIETNKDKAKLAADLDIQIIHDPEYIEDVINFATDSFGADCTIVTPDCFDEVQFEHALQITRKKGRIVIPGDASNYINKTLAYQKEIDILFSLSYGPGRFDNSYEYLGLDYPYSYVRWTENRNMQLFVDMIEDKKLDLSEFVKHEYNLSKLGEAANKVRANDCVGVVLDYNPLQEYKNLPDKKCKAQSNNSDNSEPKFIPAYKDNLNVCIFGINKNTRLKLLPTVSSIENIKVNTVIDKNMTMASNAAKWYGARALSGGADHLFCEDSDVVVIGPTGEITVDQIINLLKKGKAVLTTRPIVYDFEDLQKMTNLFKELPSACFSTGYYRSYSPFIQKIRSELLRKKTPIMAQFRMNAGYIPKEQLLSPQWKPGRVIAQAAHVFDLFCYLTNSKPVTISAESLRPSNESFPTDNFTTTITFADGSICSLLFTSLGDPEMGQERLELFFDSKSIIMDNYLKLDGYGLPASFEEKCRTPDLGYDRFMRAFFEYARSRNNKILPISFDRLLTVAKINLTVDNLVCSGGGEEKI